MPWRFPLTRKGTFFLLNTLLIGYPRAIISMVFFTKNNGKSGNIPNLSFFVNMNILPILGQ